MTISRRVDQVLPPPARRRQLLRLAVHVGLLVTVAVSVGFEPVLGVHIIVGLAFVALVVAHLLQRRRVSAGLSRQLLRVGSLHRPAGRLALADTVLLALTVGLLASGLWDWIAGHPTRIRWHALTGVVLIGLLLVHTARRRSRLRSSHVR